MLLRKRNLAQRRNLHWSAEVRKAVLGAGRLSEQQVCRGQSLGQVRKGGVAGGGAGGQQTGAEEESKGGAESTPRAGDREARTKREEDKTNGK